mmetsp:Transcript_21217/g.45562  ORF Transcript_21217/g.45562 Transcript_21217/m.45562 type:complete len:172 (-) Transcript_21217:106-621(-)
MRAAARTPSAPTYRNDSKGCGSCLRWVGGPEKKQPATSEPCVMKPLLQLPAGQRRPEPRQKVAASLAPWDYEVDPVYELRHNRSYSSFAALNQAGLARQTWTVQLRDESGKYCVRSSTPRGLVPLRGDSSFSWTAGSFSPQRIPHRSPSGTPPRRDCTITALPSPPRIARF